MRTKRRKPEADYVPRLEMLGEREYLICGSQRLEVRRLRADTRKDELLNQAAACADYRIRVVTFTKRQEKSGWPGIAGKKLPGETQSVTDSVGRKKRQLFFRRADIEAAIKRPESQRGETPDRVLHEGKWRCKKQWAIDQLGIGAGDRFAKWCIKYGIRFQTLAITSRRNWRGAEWCIESEFKTKRDAWLASRASEDPPPIDGRPSTWGADFLKAIRGGGAARAYPAKLRQWAEACPYLGGRKLKVRAVGQLTRNSRTQYVDKEQADAILAAIVAESQWKPARGYYSERQLAERLGYRSKTERHRLYLVLRACRDGDERGKPLLVFERSPLDGWTIYYHVDRETEEGIRKAMALVRRVWVQPPKTSRQSGWKAGHKTIFIAAVRQTWKEAGARNDEFLRLKELGKQPREIRNLWNAEHANAKVTIATVKTGIKRAKKRRNGAKATLN
jgi:hypothetical protein